MTESKCVTRDDVAATFGMEQRELDEWFDALPDAPASGARLHQNPDVPWRDETLYYPDPPASADVDAAREALTVQLRHETPDTLGYVERFEAAIRAESTPRTEAWQKYLDRDKSKDVLKLRAEAEATMAALREALTDVLDDYLASNGPDGYPQPMPESWRVIQRWLAATPEADR